MSLTSVKYPVVGVTFENRQEFLGEFYKTFSYGRRYRVSLKLEDDNKYDPNAVAVYLFDEDDGRHQIGYIAKTDNVALRNSLPRMRAAYLASMGPNRNGDIGASICVEYEDDGGESAGEE